MRKPRNSSGKKAQKINLGETGNENPEKSSNSILEEANAIKIGLIIQLIKQIKQTSLKKKILRQFWTNDFSVKAKRPPGH